MSSETQKHRVFIALPISEKLQQEILEWEKKFQTLPVRWLSGKNLHITIIPPWYETDVEGIREKLTTIREKFSTFEIAFERISFGPDPKRPRLIWLEGEAPEEIKKLKIKIENVLGIESEIRPFKLHLTLARFRPRLLRQRSVAGGPEIFYGEPGRTISSFPIKNLNEEVFWRDEAKSFVLMESHLSPEGADYEILEEIRL